MTRGSTPDEGMEQKLAGLSQRVAELEAAETRHQATETTLRKTEQDLRNANMRLSDALTELKKSQRQLVQYERLTALCQMARGIAHDFNNALMPILGFSDFLLNNPDLLQNRQETLEILTDIRSAAKNAAGLIRRLREFYRSPDDAQMYLPVDLNRVIEQALDSTRPRWKDEMESHGTPITIVRELQEIPPATGVESQLQELLIHLLGNSIDAMPQGGTITVRSLPDGQWIRIEVEDTGTGMSGEVLSRCFEPFFTTKGPSGTGMGLAIAYGTVRRHGGTIEARSEPGHGTIVAVKLPQHLVIETTPAISAAPPPRLRALIIDDDPWSCHVTFNYLANRKDSVETAESGGQGIAKLREERFDLVVTDRAMPDMSGDQVARVAKELHPETRVIMVTGFGDVMLDGGECPSGVDLILSKPITEYDLLTAIARVFAPKPTP